MKDRLGGKIGFYQYYRKKFRAKQPIPKKTNPFWQKWLIFRSSGSKGLGTGDAGAKIRRGYPW
jgi:hypothetical protein